LTIREIKKQELRIMATMNLQKSGSGKKSDKGFEMFLETFKNAEIRTRKPVKFESWERATEMLKNGHLPMGYLRKAVSIIGGNSYGTNWEPMFQILNSHVMENNKKSK
jgi:hypothetical protein